MFYLRTYLLSVYYHTVTSLLSGRLSVTDNRSSLCIVHCDLVRSLYCMQAVSGREVYILSAVRVRRMLYCSLHDNKTIDAKTNNMNKTTADRSNMSIMMNHFHFSTQATILFSEWHTFSWTGKYSVT